ncbi:hypothetical protein CO683_40470 [Bradyrhizobium ottawaense]|nr:hypothetical protein CO683_40470 [Bradyrhizobium ottawaense]
MSHYVIHIGTMTITIRPDLKIALLGEETTVSPPTTQAAVFLSHNDRDHQHAADLARLIAVLTVDGTLGKKHFWSTISHSDIKPSSLLVSEKAEVCDVARAAATPFWREHAQIDEAYISRKKIDAIRDEVIDLWKSILPSPVIVAGHHDFPENAPAEPDSDLYFCLHHEIAHVHLSEADVQRIELAVKQAIEKRVRLIQRFVFKWTRAYLCDDDAVRVAIHCYRVRTGISPPGIDPNRTTFSSSSASISISEENYHEYVRRPANRGRLQRPTPYGCARKRRSQSRQANRHPARSRQARGLSNCGTRTHRKASQHHAANLLLQHRRPVVGDVPMAA